MKTDDSANWHGSCVSSLAAGLNHGVSKESKIIMLKSSQRLRDILWAFSRARDSVRSAGIGGRAVILFTAAATFTNERYIFWIRIKEIMQELFEAGAIIVVPAGNYAQTKKRYKEIDTIPARWSSPGFPLIVAGAVNDLRHRAPFSQGPEQVTVYAPGVNVICANDIKASGTSYAAAMVGKESISYLTDTNLFHQTAGLLAYYLSLDTPPFATGDRDTAQNARDYLQSSESSWSRTHDGINVIWNGQDGSKQPS